MHHNCNYHSRVQLSTCDWFHCLRADPALGLPVLLTSGLSARSEELVSSCMGRGVRDPGRVRPVWRSLGDDVAGPTDNGVTT